MHIPTYVNTLHFSSSVHIKFTGIFPSDHNRYFCYIMMVFITAWAIAAFFMTLFQCSPIEAYWLPIQYPNAKCMSIITLFFSTGFINVTSDFLIFLWPAKDLANLQISFKQRVTLIAMFTLGVTICIAGICRLWYTTIFGRSYDVLCTFKPLPYAIPCARF